MAATIEGSAARHVGIVVKHRVGSATGRGGRCNCRRIYQAAVWSARDAKRIRKHFDTADKRLAGSAHLNHSNLSKPQITNARIRPLLSESPTHSMFLI